MGRRREVVLLEKELRDTGYLMICRETDAQGNPFIRKYWPNLAFEPIYLEDPPCRNSDSRSPDAGGDTGRGVLFWDPGTPDPGTPHVEGEENTEFLTPTGVEGSDRITDPSSPTRSQLSIRDANEQSGEVSTPRREGSSCLSLERVKTALNLPSSSWKASRPLLEATHATSGVLHRRIDAARHVGSVAGNAGGSRGKSIPSGSY